MNRESTFMIYLKWFSIFNIHFNAYINSLYKRIKQTFIIILIV
jgi:hypothetical protein